MPIESVIESVNQQTQESSPESVEQVSTSENTQTQETAPGLSGKATPQSFELDKMEKFKYKGKEYTVSDLEKAFLRQKDYTKKMQEMAQTQESFNTERKFYENLYADLQNVKDDPRLAAEFIKIYPEKFYAYLEQVLKQSTSAQSQTSTGNQPSQPDVQLMSRLNKLETFYHEQEVAKVTTSINSQIDKLKVKYPDAIPEIAIARIYEAHNEGTKITNEMWDKAFKDSQDLIEGKVKAKYGDYVKKQTEANKKARDVDAGGGTPGKAPKKFKSLKEVTEFAVSDMTGKQ